MLKIKEWYLRKFKNQSCFMYCTCGNELVSSNSKYTTKDHICYEYKCNKCGKKSKWILDTPVPIKIEDK